MIGFVLHAPLLHRLIRTTYRWKQPMSMMPPGGITSGNYPGSHCCKRIERSCRRPAPVIRAGLRLCARGVTNQRPRVGPVGMRDQTWWRLLLALARHATPPHERCRFLYAAVYSGCIPSRSINWRSCCVSGLSVVSSFSPIKMELAPARKHSACTASPSSCRPAESRT